MEQNGSRYMEHNGRKYTFLVGSDVIRDGMYLEFTDEQGDDILEIFYSDVDHEMAMTCWKQYVPLEVVEWAIGVARTQFAGRKPYIEAINRH
jgi:hypothetical protein